ncbi:LacI family DNA-binding transcriptional regulator [Ferruginibacter yonginensis]|uniref:LacI family DNA-binding transcriptional regulator n=1 Tax=Ferruginibacter yonginensis TaxID=1310416 RepID=A0ABV8QSW0_9BACT
MNLKQLAQELNLSISSVSRALRDSKEISEKTKKLVLAKAKEHNYHANHFASNLRKQKSKTIAVVIPEIANNFFSSAINGAESFIQKKGFHVLIYQTHDDVQQEVAIAKHLQNGRVDGIMMSLTSHTSSIHHLKEIQHKNIPLVFFDRVPHNIEAPKITTNDYESALKATEHLIKNGATKIAILCISNILSITNNRKEGYEAALKNHQLKINKNYILTCDDSREANKQQIRKLLSSANRPNAIFACVEELAICSFEICQELGLKIPQDIKIISYSNLQTADILNPSLTTVTQPAYEIGKEAAAVLFKLIEATANEKIPNKEIVLKSQLFVRNSTKK